MSSAASLKTPPDPSGEHLRPDIAQFVALSAPRGASSRFRRDGQAQLPRWTSPRRAFRALSTSAETHYRPGLLASIDDQATELARAERRLTERFEADIATVALPANPCDVAWTAERLAHLEALLVACRTPSDRRLLAMLAYALAVQGRHACHVARLALRAVDDGRLIDDDIRSPALMAAGIALGLAGETAAAEGLFSRILPCARAMRSHAVFSAACAQRGIERYHRGALGEAMADLQEALHATRGQPWETMVDDGRAYLLRIHAERGDLEAAERMLQTWCATGPLPETSFGHRILIERGRLRLAQGRFREAAHDLTSAGRRLGDRGDSIMFEWRGPAAMAHHLLGEEREALELAYANADAARSWGAPQTVGKALVTLGLIEGRRAGIRRLREAVATLESTPAVLELARALIDLGAVLRRDGEPSEARSHLLRGRELAVSAGATALIARADLESSATGASRRRRTLMSGPDALTPSERRVAQLASDGRSNPEIARQLFVTRKTVEMHLGNVYRKLGIGSRQQLSPALQRHVLDSGRPRRY
jgi:DNA-binding CsgD family transcriptional regulator